VEVGERIRTSRPCKRVSNVNFCKLPRILQNCICCDYTMYICFPITIILVILQLKSDERCSVFDNFASLEVWHRQDELIPTQNRSFFLYQFAKAYSFHGEKIFFVSFNRLIICYASGTILIIIYFFRYHLFFTQSFFPVNWNIIDSFLALL